MSYIGKVAAQFALILTAQNKRKNMALKKQYFTVNGQLIGESDGAKRTNYLPDALGSTIATADESGNIENTYRYKPYGDELSKSGAAVDPSFLWVGALGYRHGTHKSTYVRRRSLSYNLAQWHSIDTHWPGTHPYAYANTNPSSLTDRLGTYPDTTCETLRKDACKRLKETLPKGKRGRLKSCMEKLGYGNVNIDPLLDCMIKNCTNPKTCIKCVNIGTFPITLPDGWPKECPDPCKKGLEGITGFTGKPMPGIIPESDPPQPILTGTDCRELDESEKDCADALSKAYPGCESVAVVCYLDLGEGLIKPEDTEMALIHELAHVCSGLAHKRDKKKDFFEALECCMCCSMFETSDACSACGTFNYKCGENK